MVVLLGKYGICILYFCIVIGSGMIIKKKFGTSDEIGRKIGHIFLTFTWFMFYVFFWGTSHFIIAPIIGITMIVVGLKTNLLYILRRGNTNEDDQGVILYPVTEFILALFAFLYAPAFSACTYGMLSLGFGDGTAALVGRRWGKYTPKIRAGKSLAGSSACFFFTILAIIVTSWLMGYDICIWKFIILALVATIAELFGNKYDNLLIGVSVAVVGVLLKVG